MHNKAKPKTMKMSRTDSGVTLGGAGLNKKKSLNYLAIISICVLASPCLVHKKSYKYIKVNRIISESTGTATNNSTLVFVWAKSLVTRKENISLI